MSVEERLEQLERKVRWMRRLGAVGVALVAVVVLMGQGKEKELPDLEVRSLTVKDNEGNERLRATVTGDAVSLTLTSKTGSTCVLSVKEKPDIGGGLHFTSKNGDFSASLSAIGLVMSGASASAVISPLALSVIGPRGKLQYVMGDGVLFVERREQVVKDGLPTTSVTGHVALDVSNDRASVRVRDAAGTQAILGKVSFVDKKP